MHANISDKHRCKNPQQNISKQNSVIYEKCHIRTTVAFSKQTLSLSTWPCHVPALLTVSDWRLNLLFSESEDSPAPPTPTPGKACSHPETSEREWHRLRTVPLRLAGHQVSVGSSNSRVPWQSGVGKGEMLGWAWWLEERFGHPYQMT